MRPTPLRTALLALAISSAAPLTGQVVSEDLEQPPAVEEPAAEVAQSPETGPPLPGGVHDLEGLAEQKYLEGDLALASQLYQAAAQEATVTPDRQRLLVAAAWLENQSERTAEALALLRQALLLDPAYPLETANYAQPFVDLYHRARQQAVEARQREAGDLVRSSLDRLAAGDAEQARQGLTQALVLVPDDPFALYNLALVEMQGGRTEEAIAGFERLLSLHAGRPEGLPVEIRAQALSSLGLLYYTRGYLEDARSYLQQSADLAPDDPRTWNNLGLTLRRLGRSGEAQAAFVRASGLAPEDAQIANNLAATYIAEDRWSEALAILRAASERAPGDPSVWLNLALAQRGAGDLAGAGDSLQRVIALDPDDGRGLSRRASSYLAVVRYQQGDFPAAAAAAERALALEPRDVEALVYLGLAQQASGDAASARASFERAVAADPSRPEVYNNLGTALVALGDYAGAEAAFRQALAIRPDFPEALGNLRELETKGATGGVPRVTTGATATPPPPPPAARRDLGLRVSTVEAGELGIRGARVESVAYGSPAARAGLRDGDLVLAADGSSVPGAGALLDYLGSLPVGREVRLELLRDGRPAEARLRIE